ncbi:MAG: SH3 domain-containing protein [Rickettsiaceae bacterium]|nr:SH3 domain-containing protein [Rickettsiaceae bacterium]
MINNITLIITLILFAQLAQGSEKQSIPRFVSIKASEANTRSGPGANYKTLYLYQYKGLPVEVIAEYEQWRKIKDINGDEGWIHSSILSGKRSIIVSSKNEELLYKSDSLKSKIVARLNPGMVCGLIKCTKSWCKVKCQDYTGWIGRSSIWGVYGHEEW